jgi:putative intracellular protease/amidase
MRVKHVLCIATNTAVLGPFERTVGFFFPEIAHPFEVLEEAGIAVEFASPLGGIVPDDGYDSSDPAQKKFLESAAYRRLQRSRKLSEVDVLDHKLTSFSKAEEDGYAARDVSFDLEGVLREAGAEYSCAEPWQPHLIVDGRLITGQNPASGTAVGKALVEALAKVE